MKKQQREKKRGLKNQPNITKNKLRAILAGFALLGSLAFAVTTKANPLEFLVENQGTYGPTATTSITYMTAGTATTTSNVYDTYANGNGNTYATNKLALEVQFTASSTASTLGWFYEYTQGTAGADCVNTPKSCDWYADNTLLATTTVNTATVAQTYVWTFASSTQGGGLPSGNRVNKMFIVPTPARYVRAVLYLVPASANGGVWAAFIGQKESSR